MWQDGSCHPSYTDKILSWLTVWLQMVANRKCDWCQFHWLRGYLDHHLKFVKSKNIFRIAFSLTRILGEYYRIKANAIKRVFAFPLVLEVWRWQIRRTQRTTASPWRCAATATGTSPMTSSRSTTQANPAAVIAGPRCVLTSSSDTNPAAHKRSRCIASKAYQHQCDQKKITKCL